MENIIRTRCSFIELLDKLEKISIDFVDLTGFNDYIYMDPRNEFNYKISSLINNNETYKFYYIKKYDVNTIYEEIPNAIFLNNSYYDFEIDIKELKFKKFDEYKIVSIDEVKHTIINMNINDGTPKQKSLLRKMLGC